MPHVICEPCIGVLDAACVKVCPVGCIIDAGDQYVINPKECVDCGACVDVCPVSAIYYHDEVPAHWRRAITRNAVYFMP